MICESCGSRIPDGAKFCTECGAKVPETPAVPDVILPDIPDVILPDVPDIPDVILPNAPMIPDISQSVLREEEPSSVAEPEPEEDPAPEEEAAAAPAWSAVSPAPAAPRRPAPSPSPAPAAAYTGTPNSAAGPSLGYSTVSGYARVPADVPDAARKPLWKRWWFWLLIVLGVAALVFVLFVALIVYSMRNTMPPIDDLPPVIEEILGDTEDLDNIDQLPSILENAVDDPDEAPFPLDADDRFTPMDTLVDQIDRELADMGLEHEVSADEDGWVFVNVWTDGLDGLAEAAYEGDEASLADWNALTENIRVMSEDFLGELLAGGQHSAVCVVSLLDDLDTDLSLAVAVDGELVLDLVNGIDEYGILEE